MRLKSVWGWSENCKLRKSTGANRSGAFLYHGPDRIRTDDPHNANVVRSQLRYRPKCFKQDYIISGEFKK